jgi:hypothetical protein
VVKPGANVLGSWGDPDPLTPATLALQEGLLRLVGESEYDIVLDRSSVQAMRNGTSMLLTAHL